MCTTIKEPMKIRCSEDTYKLLKDTKILNFKLDIVEAKGKGKMKTYFVELS